MLRSSPSVSHGGPVHLAWACLFRLWMLSHSEDASWQQRTTRELSLFAKLAAAHLPDLSQSHAGTDAPQWSAIPLIHESCGVKTRPVQCDRWRDRVHRPVTSNTHKHLWMVGTLRNETSVWKAAERISTLHNSTTAVLAHSPPCSECKVVFSSEVHTPCFLPLDPKASLTCSCLTAHTHIVLMV